MGADVNLTGNIFSDLSLMFGDSFGSTALSSAVFNNFYSVADFLIQKGANVKLKNNYGKTGNHGNVST